MNTWNSSLSHPSNNPPHRIILVAPNHPSNKITSKNIRIGCNKAYLVNIRAWLMYLYMRNGKHKIRVLPQHTSYVHIATVRAMCWISTNNSCYGSTSMLRWHISFNSVRAGGRFIFKSFKNQAIAFMAA